LVTPERRFDKLPSNSFTTADITSSVINYRLNYTTERTRFIASNCTDQLPYFIYTIARYNSPRGFYSGFRFYRYM
jgi:hypothetical protein